MFIYNFKGAKLPSNKPNIVKQTDLALKIQTDFFESVDTLRTTHVRNKLTTNIRFSRIKIIIRVQHFRDLQKDCLFLDFTVRKDP